MPDATPIIRQARSGEGESLGLVGFTAWDEGEISTAARHDVDRARIEAHFIAFCSSDYAAVLVAESDGRPVAWGARENRDYYISDLWVSPTSQGRGIGRRLLQAMESDIAKAGFGSAELGTAAVDSGAIRFYRRAGYDLIWRGWKYSAELNQNVEKVRLARRLGPRED